MAVELRCPECRTKLRLKTAPEAGTEVECPKCATVFPAPEPEPDDEDAPKKKKTGVRTEEPSGEDRKGDKEQKGAKAKTKKAGKGVDANPNAPRKRKAKKKETSKAALIGVISVGALMFLSMTGVLIWFFSRTSKAVEMFYYVPEDAQTAMGINLGHAQKYPVFYKTITTLYNGTDFKPAGDAIAKAAGGGGLDDLADYVVQAESSAGRSIVFHTKTEFDDSTLAKIPGAAKQTLDGKTYYLAAVLQNNERARVFSPTKRLVVVCPESTREATFKKILNGHADTKEKTLGVRMGDLGKRVTRGTFWLLIVFDGEVKPPSGPAESGSAPPTGVPTPPAAGGQDDAKVQGDRVKAEGLASAKGFGVKASLGSREIRFEIDVWYKNSENASNFAKKMKESELGKGDEGNPPRWFKNDTQALGDKKVAAQILSNLGFGSSGEVFYVRSAVDTAELQQGGGNIIGKVLGLSSRSGGGPGGMPNGPPGGGPPGAPGGRPPGPVPPKPRRRPVPGRVPGRVAR